MERTQLFDLMGELKLPKVGGLHHRYDDALLKFCCCDTCALRFGARSILFRNRFTRMRNAFKPYLWPSAIDVLFGDQIIFNHDLHRQTDSEVKDIFKQRQVDAPFSLA